MKRKSRRTRSCIRYRAKDGRLGRRHLKLLAYWFSAVILLAWLHNYFFTPLSESEARVANQPGRYEPLARALGVNRIVIKKTDPSGTKTYRGNIGRGVGLREDGLIYNLRGWMNENGELILNIDVE